MPHPPRLRPCPRDGLQALRAVTRRVMRSRLARWSRYSAMAGLATTMQRQQRNRVDQARTEASHKHNRKERWRVAMSAAKSSAKARAGR